MLSVPMSVEARGEAVSPLGEVQASGAVQGNVFGPWLDASGNHETA